MIGASWWAGREARYAGPNGELRIFRHVDQIGSNGRQPALAARRSSDREAPWQLPVLAHGGRPAGLPERGGAGVSLRMPSCVGFGLRELVESAAGFADVEQAA